MSLMCCDMLVPYSTVFAFDKDKARLATLNKMVRNAGATCVTTRLQDFLTVRKEIVALKCMCHWRVGNSLQLPCSGVYSG